MKFKKVSVFPSSRTGTVEQKEQANANSPRSTIPWAERGINWNPIKMKTVEQYFPVEMLIIV